MRQLSPNHECNERLRIAGLSNEELLTETLKAMPGDDYDGEFTPNGEVTVTILEETLRKRLSDAGFII